jgi:hypothetical protein
MRMGHELVAGVPGLWERRGSDDGGGAVRLQCPVDQFEIKSVILGADVLDKSRFDENVVKRRKQNRPQSSLY